MWQNYATDDPSDAMARNAVVNSVHRLWQAPLAEVDPDVVYFRRRLNLLTDQQLEWLRDLADVCGFRAVSDPPGWLSPDELDSMITYLSRRPEIGRARPLPLHHRRPRGRLRRRRSTPTRPSSCIRSHEIRLEFVKTPAIFSGV